MISAVLPLFTYKSAPAAKKGHGNYGEKEKKLWGGANAAE
jgi:hypothetical protein